MRRRRVNLILAMPRDVDEWNAPSALAIRLVGHRTSFVAADAEVVSLVESAYPYVDGDENVGSLLPRAR